MLGPGNNLILQRAAQITEIITVSRHPHDQIAVLFWVLLGGAQRIRIHHVKLDMVPIQPEVSAHQLNNAV